MGSTVGSLFSGYGGLDLAAERFFGADTIWTSEVEPAPSRVLDYRFPHAANLGDVTKIDWSNVPRVTVLTGGSPCQDVSISGPRKGMMPGTRSGLWASMREGIAVLRPQFVVWENVKGALSAKASSNVERAEGRVGGMRALGRVLGDLASLGYDASWGVVRASDAGLPHRRERVFVLATTDTHGLPSGSGQDLERLVEQGVSFEGGVTPTFGQSGFGATHEADQNRVEEDLVRYGSYASAVRRARESFGPEPIKGGLVKGVLDPRFSEWMMGLPRGWVCDVPGLTESEKLRMLGNGVAPRQAELALHLLAPRLKEVL